MYIGWSEFICQTIGPTENCIIVPLMDQTIGCTGYCHTCGMPAYAELFAVPSHNMHTLLEVKFRGTTGYYVLRLHKHVKIQRKCSNALCIDYICGHLFYSQWPRWIGWGWLSVNLGTNKSIKIKVSSHVLCYGVCFLAFAIVLQNLFVCINNITSSYHSSVGHSLTC